jgi:hypothetical protein
MQLFLGIIVATALIGFCTGSSYDLSKIMR